MAGPLYTICMPSLGADMTAGTLVEWLIKVGDEVKKGDVVAVIETQKGAIDMEAYQSGRVSEILVQPVTEVPVGTPLAQLITGCASACAIESEPEPEPEPELKPEPEPELPSPDAPSAGGLHVSSAADTDRPAHRGPRASPIVRTRAASEGLDLASIHGTGPEGAIILRDLDAVHEAKAESHGDGMRAAIARAMAQSNREIPHYYLALDVDIGAAQRWLEQYNADKEPAQRMLLLALLLKAVACTLADFPALNGHLREGQFRPSRAIHIANVISLRGGGIVVPAIRDVEQHSVEAVMDALRDISRRARSGHLRSSELTDATITVTSMGERGSDLLLGLIYPPQVAILGVGRARREPEVQGNEIVIGDRLTLSLGADHRVSDGLIGAKFLNALAKTLQKPELL